MYVLGKARNVHKIRWQDSLSCLGICQSSIWFVWSCMRVICSLIQAVMLVGCFDGLSWLLVSFVDCLFFLCSCLSLLWRSSMHSYFSLLFLFMFVRVHYIHSFLFLFLFFFLLGNYLVQHLVEQANGLPPTPTSVAFSIGPGGLLANGLLTYAVRKVVGWVNCDAAKWMWVRKRNDCVNQFLAMFVCVMTFVYECSLCGCFDLRYVYFLREWM